MKKLYLLLFLLAISSAYQPLAAQIIKNIDIVNSNDVPANTVGICQCDTLAPAVPAGRVGYFLQNPYNPTSTFTYELGLNNDFTAPILLSRVGIFANSTGTTVANEFTAGTKWVELVIPCSTPVGPAALRIRNSNGDISDTIYFIVNRVPAKPVLQMDGGFLNPYNPVPTWSFCPGDSLTLKVNKQLGASYQWLNLGAPIPGETDTFFVVKNAGSYAMRITLGGGCSKDSKDTLITTSVPPVAVTNIGLPPNVFQIDNPIPTNGSARDSVQFCEDKSFLLQANAPAPSATVTFRYTWLSDSVNIFGDQIFYQTRPGDTNRSLMVDSSIIYEYPQNFYVIVDDGFCRDTSKMQPYMVFMDSMPRTDIMWRNYKNGNQGNAMSGDVCMTDSTLLFSTGVADPNWRYQWQRLNTAAPGGPIWQNISVFDPNRNGKAASLQVDTALKPIQPLSYYRLVTTTVTPFNESVVCRFITDSVRIRWYPEDSITVATGQPWANIVGQDSVSICETDSVVLRAPASPNSFSLPYTYQWLTDSIGLGGGRIIYPTSAADVNRNFTVFNPGRYYVIIDDGICVDTIRPYRVFVDTIPSTGIAAAAGYDLDLCLYDSTIITATDTLLPFWRYQWEQYVEGSGWINRMNDTLPSLKIDSSDIVNNDTLYFRINTEYTNQFGLTICPFTSDSIMVVFYDSPQITLFPSDSIGLCFMDSVFVVAQGDGFTYRWLDLPNNSASRWIYTTGTYTVRVTGVNGCVTLKDLIVYDLQITGSASGNQTINSGEVATLSATGGTSYRWYADEPLDFSDFLSSTIKVSKTLGDEVTADTVTVYVIITNGDGCRKLDSLKLYINNTKDDSLILLQNVYNLFTPNGDGSNDIWDISRITQGKVCEVLIMNRWGSELYRDETWDGTWNGADQGGNPLPDGTYYYILSCSDKVILKSAVTLIRNE